MNYETYENYIGVQDDFHEVMRQDLIIYATNMTTGEVISTPGSTVDITPTILNLINSDSEFGYFIGQDLLSGNANYILFADLTISDGSNILYLDETYNGNASNLSILETALEERITALEIQKKLLTCDYFNRKLNNE
jgi:phosphoglycerol transferase MdoB-like AlkP superfamily enzyme